jgi:RNA polymerase sigma-70 factor, ECF subfamily
LDDLADSELIERIRAGKTALYETLMRRYNQRLYRIARVILRNPEEAEDVVQEAYVRAYTHLDQFAGAAKFSTWLTKIAIHEALARLHKRRRMGEADSTKDTEKSGGMESLKSTIHNPEEQIFEKQVLELLEAAVEALPDNLRSVFVMREIEEMSTAETAECLGLSEAAVKIRLHRARKVLRQDLYLRVGAVSSQAFRFLGERCDRVIHAVMERIRTPKCET